MEEDQDKILIITTLATLSCWQLCEWNAALYLIPVALTVLWASRHCARQETWATLVHEFYFESFQENRKVEIIIQWTSYTLHLHCSSINLFPFALSICVFCKPSEHRLQTSWYFNFFKLYLLSTKMFLHIPIIPSYLWRSVLCVNLARLQSPVAQTLVWVLLWREFAGMTEIHGQGSSLLA